MKAFKLVFAIFIGLLFSCNTKQDFKSIDKRFEIDSLIPLQRTVIADLPDSLQPKTFLIEEMPKSKVRALPSSGGETVLLPVLEDENGEPILDEEGHTILMGDGGLSDFTTFTTDDGLALDVVQSSMIDKIGNLWFGTQRGVSRFDGKAFTNFTTSHGLTSNDVWKMMEDKSGNLWFATVGGGVSKYDGQNFSNFTINEGLLSNDVYALLEDNSGNFWFGTQAGITKYDGLNYTYFTTQDGLGSNEIRSILEDKNGNFWFGTNGGGISRYDGNSFATYSTEQGLQSNYIWNILEDKSGILLVGDVGIGGGLSQYRDQFFTGFLTELDQTKNNAISTIFEDSGGILWFGSWQKGVSQYNGKSLKSFTTSQGLASSSVWSITEDNNGNIWFGTLGGGVSRYNGNAFTNFYKNHGLPNSSVRSITEDKTGNLWLGTDAGGVSRYDGKSFTTFLRAQGLSDLMVTSTIEDLSGNFWFSTLGNGVYRFDGKLFTNFSTVQGLTSNAVVSLLEDQEGNLWFATYDGGISKFDGKSFTNFTKAQGLADIILNSIFQDKFGNIWLGTNGYGVSLYDGKSFTNFTIDQGLANNTVNSIFTDSSGNLWFATDEGVSLLELKTYKEIIQGEILNGSIDSLQNSKNQLIPNSKELIQKSERQNRIPATLFKSFGIANGLPDNMITQVLQMPNGKMAVGTNLGIAIFNISEDHSTITDLEIFNTSTGYPVKDVNAGQNAMLLDSKGIIWAATGSESTGLVRFDYEALNRRVEPPTVIIQSIKIKDENISWHSLNAELNSEKLNSEDSITTPAYITEEVGIFGRELRTAERDSLKQRFGKIDFDGIRPFYPLPENLVLPYNLNQISFEFVAIETSRPQMVRYQYLLEGYDEDWSPVTNRSNASFGNIHEGNYTFKLKAQGANGIWTEPVTYSFTVLPPWYRTWWAYGIYFLFLAGIAWRTHQVQKAKTIRIEREKNRDRELAQAKEIEKAYGELGIAHKTLKSTQAQLIQSEKMASLGELTAGIAHEIQNPLNFVNNFSEVSNELLEEVVEERAKNQEARDENLVTEILGDVKENLSKITLHGKRADAIVKGMLEHSKRGSGQKELTDINALAKEYLNLAYQSFKSKNKEIEIELISNFDPTLPKLELVRPEIGKVLLNILNNAFYASALEGHTERSRSATVSLSTRNLGDKIEISVSDNGTGIPDSIKDKIFQPFFTTKPTGQGTGLGLSLSYDIVKAHGGEINVVSKAGEFTEFKILLPV